MHHRDATLAVAGAVIGIIASAFLPITQMERLIISVVLTAGLIIVLLSQKVENRYEKLYALDLFVFLTLFWLTDIIVKRPIWSQHLFHH